MNHKDQHEQYRRTVGRLLRDARVLSGAGSQSDVARKLSEVVGETVPPSRIGNYEQGTRFPDPITMKYLAGIYGVPAHLLYGFDEAGVSPEEYRIIEAYRSTDDRGREMIDQVAENQPQYPQVKTEQTAPEEAASKPGPRMKGPKFR